MNLIGDTLAQLPALERYKRTHSHERVVWLLHDIPPMQLFRGVDEIGVVDELIFWRDPEDEGNSHPISSMEVPERRVFGKKVLMQCRRAWHLSLNKQEHMAQGYARTIGLRLGPHDVLARLKVDDLNEDDLPAGRPLPVSINSHSSDPKHGDGFSGNKNFPVKAWVKLLTRMRDKGYTPIQLLGPEETVVLPGFPVVQWPIRKVAAFIQACGQYAGVDNGITHIAACLGVKCFVIYPCCLPIQWAGYTQFPHYHAAHVYPNHGDVDRVWKEWRAHA